MAGPPGLILAAPASGSGKTLVTLALLRALVRHGVRAVGAKAGPDYIDPQFHAAACGRPCLNLDPWAMREETIAALVAALGREGDFVICEGVMGLFDGIDAAGHGSTADLAQRIGWPVILIVDAAGQAASAAALVNGFVRHRDDVTIAGVLFNRVGAPAHGAILRDAVAATLPDLPVLGCLPRDPALVLPSRHLGLVQPCENAGIEAILEHAGAWIGAAVDLEKLRALARPARLAEAHDDASPLPPLGSKIAIARDDAFAFAYPATLEGWRRAGASLTFFSPLADEPPAKDADAVYLPGGYPELHAGRIAANARFLDGLRHLAARGVTVYGECGGYMSLGRGLVDAKGQRHAMAGLLPLETSFAERRLHLGYRAAQLVRGCALGQDGAAFRGHEFHYASVVDEGPGDPLFETANAAGRPLGAAGRRTGAVMGSFVHLIDRA
jgi:cobyrinic acid a,c-diamide synthase